jgi:hypothetical protein|nr:MAG TPA: hypothetical protein [Ackermannviridae sp.]
MTNIKKIINEELNNIVQEKDGGQVYNGIIKSLDHVDMVFDSIEDGLNIVRQENGYTKRKFYRLSKDAQRIRKSIQNLRDIMKKTYYNI